MVQFESPHVRPLALTPDGQRLLVVNTADARLAVFDLGGPSPARVGEIPVGLEPVAVQVRDDTEAWVVNHLGDDVSIVDLPTLRVRATLHVGDEPADVVFAGSPARAFVSVSGEDVVKVYDPADLAAPPVVIPVRARAPRALAVSPDGQTVYAATFHAANHTTVLPEAVAGGQLPPPNPPMAAGLPAAPAVGLIVRQGTDGVWRDEAGTSWNAHVPYTLPDRDVVVIEAATATATGALGDLGSTIFALAAAPGSGTLAVAAQEARNAVRFEPNLRGHVADTRLALVATGGATTLVPLDPDIAYGSTPGPPSEADSAIGLPAGVAWSADGQRVYVTSLASDRLAVVGAAGQLLARVPTLAGPSGVVVDAARGRLYVASRVRNQLEVFATRTLASKGTFATGFDPTPDAVVNGRRVFYSGHNSGHGDAACATCHLNGDLDLLAWDLGDPQGAMAPVPPGMLAPGLSPFHPMKGPLTTQTLRGLNGTGRLHWRADRAGLPAFRDAFVTLLGAALPPPDSVFQAFSDFVLALAHPPNPNRRLDRSLPTAPVGQPSAARGQTLFLTAHIDGTFLCVSCHAQPTGTNGQMSSRSELFEAQDMKVPQLRNLYRKSGFADTAGAVAMRGFGFSHNGEKATLDGFLQSPRFNFGTGTGAAQNRADMVAFLLAFDTGAPPALGAEITFDGTNGSDPAALARLDTLVALADAGECDLVAHGRRAGVVRGWRYDGGVWQADRTLDPWRTTAQLVALGAPGGEVTVLGVPVGAGARMGIDRDRDGWLDEDERLSGSDPGDPASRPVAAVEGRLPAEGLTLAGPNPFRGEAALDLALSRAQRVSISVLDVQGRTVRGLEPGRVMAAGRHRIAWDGRADGGREAAPGVYFVRVGRPDGAFTARLIRLP